MTGSIDSKVFLKRLARARDEGRAALDIDFDRVTHPHCPLPYESMKGRIVYIYLAAVAVGAFACRWGFGLTWTTTGEILLGASVVYWLLGKRVLEALATRSIINGLLNDGDAWEKLWRYGGLTVRVLGPDARAWVAPKDSWKDAYDHLASPAESEHETKHPDIIPEGNGTRG